MGFWDKARRREQIGEERKNLSWDFQSIHPGRNTGVFPSSWGSRSDYSTFRLAWSFSSSLEKREISPFLWGGRRDYLWTPGFSTLVGTFHLLTNTSKENREVSPFLEGVKKRLSLDTIIFNTFGTCHLLTNTSNHGRV
jgi:hypothetical protein